MLSSPKSKFSISLPLGCDKSSPYRTSVPIWKIALTILGILLISIFAYVQFNILEGIAKFISTFILFLVCFIASTVGAIKSKQTKNKIPLALIAIVMLFFVSIRILDFSYINNPVIVELEDVTVESHTTSSVRGGTHTRYNLIGYNTENNQEMSFSITKMQSQSLITSNIELSYLPYSKTILDINYFLKQ